MFLTIVVNRLMIVLDWFCQTCQARKHKLTRYICTGETMMYWEDKTRKTWSHLKEPVMSNKAPTSTPCVKSVKVVSGLLCFFEVPFFGLGGFCVLYFTVASCCVVLALGHSVLSLLNFPSFSFSSKVLTENNWCTSLTNLEYGRYLPKVLRPVPPTCTSHTGKSKRS